MKEVSEGHCYQSIKLVNFDVHRKTVRDIYCDIIPRVASAMENRFESLSNSPVFNYLIQILDVSTWPTEDEKLLTYGDKEISELCIHFNNLLSQNQCSIENIPNEWDVLKSFLSPILKSESKTDYLEFWKDVFTNKDVSDDCKNVLQIIELLLITPFTNAKLERVFSRMNRIKTDSRNRLGQDRLDTQIRVGEEGVSIQDFDPDPYIKRWYESKVRRLNGAKPRKYPSKRCSVATVTGNKVMDIAAYTLSDLESSDDEFEGF